MSKEETLSGRRPVRSRLAMTLVIPRLKFCSNPIESVVLCSLKHQILQVIDIRRRREFFAINISNNERDENLYSRLDKVMS